MELVFKQLKATNLSQALPIYRANSEYFSLTNTVPTLATIADDYHALPPGTTRQQKAFGIVTGGNQPVAVLDLVRGYPDAQTTYVGLLLVANRGVGIGHQIVATLAQQLHQQGFKYLALAVLANNPRAQHFWTTLGFMALDERMTQVGDQAVMVVRYRKDLAPDD